MPPSPREHPPLDSPMGRRVDLAPGEVALSTFRPDAGVFARANAVLALVLATGAGLALVVMGQPSPWVGPVGAFLAVFLRAAYLRSEAMDEVWTLTQTRLIGPAGRVATRAEILAARPFFGAVQVVTRGGDKHLIKYLADPGAAMADIMAAKGGRA